MIVKRDRPLCGNHSLALRVSGGSSVPPTRGRWSGNVYKDLGVLHLYPRSEVGFGSFI